MGIYLNIGNSGFQSARNGEYIDKSGLINVVNKSLNTEMRFICVTRCRRFGKSMAAKMLNAYYDKSCDSRRLFEDLQIAKDPDFEKYLNKFNVIYLDLSAFTPRFKDSDDIVNDIENELKDDIIDAYPDVKFKEDDDLMKTLIRINIATSEQFVFIIDEWDAICREFKVGSKAMDAYITWLRRMFKDVNSAKVFALVYMTGILPIKRYKTESALNNFSEYSMVNPRQMAKYFGFTTDEVKSLCQKHNMDFSEVRAWYDGYTIGNEKSMFNPNSVMQAIYAEKCSSYWASTGAYDSVAHYVQLNFQGLKDDIIKMLGGSCCNVNVTKFQNDMQIIRGKDDILTILIHLGYLAYDEDTLQCYIPNKEVSMEMANAIEDTDWTQVINALQASDELLQATIEGDEAAVAQGIENAHDENTSILAYNNENSLACVLTIAYYSARKFYIIHREYHSGKGFADLVMIPFKRLNRPAIVVELKYKQDADTAISQIKRKEYPAKIAQYIGDIVLVGINYDKATKQHTCKIERITKS